MVYYRKYRPQNISDLDLFKVREKLTSILSSPSLPHAFLFTGSKGLGKTSAARILAKAINCNSKKGIEPCNKCEICVSITNGSNLDVLEIDAASNGGVEEIRILRERVKFASSTLKKKVYIIDEVHMLSTGAFNALLKTLEEPPSHVVFILATTELFRLPETVVSRTFQVQFEKPTEEEIVNSLERIVKGEELNVEKEVMHEIFTLADFSFRDGAKILEELALSAKNKKITKELVEKLFKTGSVKDEVYELLKSMSQRDAKKSLEVILKLTQNGTDFKSVIERIVDHLRGILMIRNSIKSEEKDIPSLKISDIKELLELSNEAYGEMRLSVIPSLPIELMIVKFCIIDVTEVGFDDVSKNTKPSETPIVAVKEIKNETPINNAESKDMLKKLFNLVNVNNKPAAALLRSCTSAVLIDNKITITTPFPIHAERLKSEKAFPDIERAAVSLVGDNITVEIKILPN